jgi:ATP synthase protein I
VSDPLPLSESTTAESSTATGRDSMQDYYQLKQALLVTTLVITGVAFVGTWIAYSLTVALNYLLGACGGLVYLRMLAREVERIGSEKRRVGSNRLALFIGLMIVATQWQQLQVLPIFLGFVTYKAAILVYTIQTTLLTPSE